MATAKNSKGKIAIASVAALVVIDQLIKALIRAALEPSHSISLGLVQIVHVSNTGSIFGVLRGAQLYIGVLSMVVVAFLIVKYKCLSKGIQKLSALFIMAGAIGNAIDRFVFGKVTDFIYVRPWPAFNLADAFLFFGAALMLSSFLTNALQKQKKQTRR